MTKKSIVVHNGGFHADDVFGVATLFLAIEKNLLPGIVKEQVEVIRTRDEAVIAKGDIVLDVGGIYDEKTHRFDHHQAGGAGVRKNGIPYASFGLLWRKFGRALTGSAEAAVQVDRRLVQTVDGPDNGVSISKSLFKDVYPFSMGDMIMSFNPSWKESDTKDDEYFLKAVAVAKTILSREIVFAQDYIEAGLEVIKNYQQSADKRIIILEKAMPFQEFLMEFPEPLIVIYPNEASNTWHAKCVQADRDLFTNRKPFPTAWAGKRDEELASITGVADAVFCHNKLFLVVAKTKEGAIQLARLALDS